MDFPVGFLIPMAYFFIRAVMNGERGPKLNMPPAINHLARPEIPIEFLPDEFKQWQSRLVRFDPDSQHPYLTYVVDVRGRFPIEGTTELVLAASVFDVERSASRDEDPELLPVICQIGEFQEADTPFYHDQRDIGVVDPGQGYRHWRQILSIIPPALVPPEAGTRKLRLLVVAYDAAHPPVFERGFVNGDVLWAASHDFTFQGTGDGYRGIEFQRISQLEYAVQFAVAAGGATGDLELTRSTVTSWIESRAGGPAIEERLDERKRLLAALETAIANAQKGRSDLPRQVRRMRANTTREDMRKALDLALLLVMQHGAHAAELAVLEKAAADMGLEPGLFHELLDTRRVRLTAGATDEKDLHAMLGLDPAWDAERTSAHLTMLYTQWNSRAESLADPQRRAEAERMLELIAEARGALIGS